MTITIPNPLPIFWVKASNRIQRQIFPSLGWRLLLAYLTSMTAVFGTSAAVLYVFLSRSLNQNLNDQLLTLVQVAAPGLDTVKTQGHHGLDRDLSLHHLFSRREQSLEWFNAEGELLAQEGTAFPPFPLVKNVSPSSMSKGSPVFQQEGQVRTVTIPVYADNLDKNPLRLKGYIRASESTQNVEVALNLLQKGLKLGGIPVLILISLSGVYLTQQSQEPRKQSFQQLNQATVDVSHQLRHPLTRINLAVDLILSHREQMQPSDVRKLEMIDSAAAQMKEAVEDLLFLARSDAADPSIGLEELAVPLNELLQNLLKSFESQAQIKGITFQTKLLPDLSVKGDATQLSRLFSHLLENAIQHTEAGGRVTLSLEQSKGSAFVSMGDTDIGIAPKVPKALPFVFQYFCRSERARFQQQERLGLAIAQAIARRHGGEITLSTQVRVGSCFRVRLPLV